MVAIVIICPDLKTVPFANGMVLVTGRLLKDGDSATYVCNEGFMLQGTLLRTCGSDGQWTGNAPFCIRKHTCIRYHVQEQLSVWMYMCIGVVVWVYV